MAKTNLGKVGLTPKKAYSASITYERLDFVTAGDSSYVSLQDNNLGHPVTDGAWWQVLASGAVVNVEGADVTINVEGNHKYICGELTSLKIGTVEKSARTSAIFFTSGNVATELTWSDDLVDIIGYKTPAPNRAYEINIEELRAIIE